VDPVMKNGHRTVEKVIRISNIYFSLHTFSREPPNQAMARTPMRTAPS
jgi:hypothetical protein